MLLQSERTPTGYRLDYHNKTQLSISSKPRAFEPYFKYTLAAESQNIFRVTFTSSTHDLPIKTLELDDVRRTVTNLKPWDGTVSFLESEAIFNDENYRLSLAWSYSPTLRIYSKNQSDCKDDHSVDPLYEDLPFKSYSVDGPGVAHYSVFKNDALNFLPGTGVDNLDGTSSLSETKHFPAQIIVSSSGVVGLYYQNYTRMSTEVHAEHPIKQDYRVTRQARGGLEFLVILGPDLQTVTSTYAALVGPIPVAPRWFAGHVGSYEPHSPNHNARRNADILKFVQNCRSFDIPISGFLINNGYTNPVIPFQDSTSNSEEVIRSLRKAGVRTLINIKPYILRFHPYYESVASQGLFIRDPLSGEPATSIINMRNSDQAVYVSHYDMTNEEVKNLWLQKFINSSRSLESGNGVWLDDNAYDLNNDDYETALSGVRRSDIGTIGRALQTKLLLQYTLKTKPDVDGTKRMTLTSATGLHANTYHHAIKYGPVSASWKNIINSIAQAIHSGPALVHNIGSDVGGTISADPLGRLSIYWIQQSVYAPQFITPGLKILDEFETSFMQSHQHSPQMKAITAIRKAIKRRYELLPYIYSLLLQGSRTGTPPIRWTGWGYERDPKIWTSNECRSLSQYWFGSFLVHVCPMENQVNFRMYLPRTEHPEGGYYNINAPYQYLEHATTRIFSLNEPVVLVPCGSVIPVGKPQHTELRISDRYPQETFDDWRAVEIFPVPKIYAVADTTYRDSWLEDDGEGFGLVSIEIEYEVKEHHINVAARMTRDETSKRNMNDDELAWRPMWLKWGLTIILPVDEARRVEGTDGRQLATDLRCRRHWVISVDVSGL